MTNDPAYRFVVVYKDGRQLSQENEKGEIVFDHCHVEDWDNVQIYALVNRSGDHSISVNFENGHFSINNNLIKMMLYDMDMNYLSRHNEAVFRPIYGRRVFVNEMGQSTYFFCGWETELEVPMISSPEKMVKKKFRRVMFVAEDGTIFFES